MIERFKFLVKKFGLREAIKSIGGLSAFREIAENHPELNPFLEDFKGSCSVSCIFGGYPDAYFDFYILDYDIMDDNFVELIVDMVVDFKNLSGEEIYDLKQWFGAVADDHGFEIYDVGNLPLHQNLFIKSFNGESFDWSGFHLDPNQVISDEEVFELLDKTGLWEGMER